MGDRMVAKSVNSQCRVFHGMECLPATTIIACLELLMSVTTVISLGMAVMMQNGIDTAMLACGWK
jgi:hypothetical protein